MATKKTTEKTVALIVPNKTIVEQSGLPAKAAEALLAEYGEPLTEASRLVAEYKAGKVLIVSDENDKEGMKKAESLRKQFKAARLALAKQHKEVKAEALNRTQAIDLVKRLALAQLEPIEEHLLLQEKYAETKKAERIAQKVAERVQELSPYVEDTSVYNFAEMTDHAYDELLAGAKETKRLKEKAEADRIAAEKAEMARIEAARKEIAQREKVAREKAEAEADELRKLQAQKEAELAKERAAREALEQAEKARQEAELAAQRAEEERLALVEQNRIAAEAKAQSAPDKEKLLAYVATIGGAEFPTLATEKGEAINLRIANHMAQTLAMYRELIEKEL